MKTATLTSAATLPQASAASRDVEMHCLAHGAVRSWPEPPRGLTIRVASGLAWLTQEACAGDFLLQPGEAFQVTEGGRVVVESLGAQLVFEVELAC